MTCYYCGCAPGKGKQELRPYGPGGSMVCAGCVMGNCKRDKVAKKQFGKQLRAAGDVAVLDGGAPRKATVAERRALIRSVKP